MGQLYHANKTLALIETLMAADQGNAFRLWQGRVLPHITDAYRQDEDPFRSHMGASQIGDDCARKIWYGFRWATVSKFSGQILRLFNRGHLEEGRFIALLLMCGYQVFQQDAQGKQFRISASEGHYGGSGDGVVTGCLDVPPGMPALCEFKTHNRKSFEKLAGSDWKDYVAHLVDPNKPAVRFSGEGVRISKFEHYVQAQQYMRKMELPVCLYGAVNKDSDEVYLELIPLDTAVADQFLDRGDQLVWMDTPPKKISESPGFWKCRFCDHRPVCQMRAPPARNCRTCAYSKPDVGGHGLWRCNLHETHIDKAKQLVGCEHYSVRKNF